MNTASSSSSMTSNTRGLQHQVSSNLATNTMPSNSSLIQNQTFLTSSTLNEINGSTSLESSTINSNIMPLNSQLNSSHLNSTPTTTQTFSNSTAGLFMF